MNISLIIPIKNDYDVYVNLCSAINLQTYQPKEIIFIDSSNDNEIEIPTNILTPLLRGACQRHPAWVCRRVRDTVSRIHTP